MTGRRAEAELLCALVHVRRGRFVAVVAVGDDELLVGHDVEHTLDEVWIGELPDAVNNAVLVGDLKIGGLCFLRFALAEDQVLGSKRGVGVEHVDLLAVGAGGFEQREAV